MATDTALRPAGDPGAPTAHPSPLAARLLAHAAPSYTFTFTPFLQRTYQHSLPADRPICKAFQSGSCPLRSQCPDRHVTAAQASGATNPSAFSSASRETGFGGFGSLVCKHWLRGLCKKGETCEFLHEYNLRKMPECNFFLRNGYCSNGDECLYLHVDPSSRLPPCPHYERGFCPLGPRCDKRHVRRRMCPYYLAGFCPEGRARCREGAHPKWVPEGQLEKPRAREESGVAASRGDGVGVGGDEEKERERERERERDRDAMMMMDRGGRDRERERDGDRHDGGRHKERFGGRGGRWRGKGGRFRGRGH